MRFVLHLLLMTTVALGLGFGLSWYALTDGRLLGAQQVGPWVFWPRAGAPDPDPYSHAFLARTGALQLGQSEGVQYVAHLDSAGEPLDRRCTYRIAGPTPTAAFWTLTPETPEGMPVATPEGPAAFNSTRLARGNDGAPILHLGPKLSSGNWIETTGTGPMTIVLTLYDVAALGGTAGTPSGLPAITREAC